MPVTPTSYTAKSPALVQIRPQGDGTGWEITVACHWGKIANGEFVSMEYDTKTYTGATVPGLTNTEKQQLAAIIGKLVIADTFKDTGQTLTNPTRTRTVWHE